MKFITSFVPEKITKVWDIGRFHAMRRMDLPSCPPPDLRFLADLSGTGNPVRRLLLEDVDRQNCIADADRILDGELRIYSLDPRIFSEGLNWHKDYYSGKVWPLAPFNRIYDPNDSGFDLNVPFEISRLQCIPTLIQAFEFNSEKKYLEKLLEIITEWSRNNPYCFGVNWWSCMEVGLRSINLVLAIAWLQCHLNERFPARLLRVLWRHALYIFEYDVVQSRVKNKNNHFLGAMLGLLAVSFCFKGRQAEEFQAFALPAFGRELARQFHEDGGNFESATGYHQFSTELALVLILLLQTRAAAPPSTKFVDTQLGAGIAARLRRALLLSHEYMATYGESPHIGDSSDCRVLIFRDYFSRRAADHGFLSRLGQVAIGFSPPAATSIIRSCYTNSGYALFRNEIYGVVAFAGPKGTGGSGGHGHNDKGSFVLQVNGLPLLVDSGTYIYNPSIGERFTLKQGKAHNALMIDDLEQCELKLERVFGMPGSINSQIRMDEDAATVIIVMEHDGYERLPELGRVRRTLRCEERRLEIVDQVDGAGSHKISTFFNIHPEAKVVLGGRSARIERNGVSVILIFPNFSFLTLEESYFSDSYHAKKNGVRIVGTTMLDLPCICEIVLDVCSS